MSKFKEYDVEEIDALCSLGKALSSPIRIEIMQLLYEEGMIIGDIAKKLDLPASSTAFHLKILEEAGLIRMEKQPGTRGTVKFCTRKVDYITVSLIKKNADVDGDLQCRDAGGGLQQLPGDADLRHVRAGRLYRK